ncbi:hypothetical protein LBMAG27_01380 [Bacteroidota bacterium]|nr:hypothetical protein LBMAG27_01380 [Bacteroidota bacterium]
MSEADQFEEIIVALTQYNVEFMVAGGYAVNFHGFNRTTGDIDLWVKPIESNKQKVFDAIRSLNFSADSISQILILNFEKPFAFKLGNEPVDIDIFNFITGVKYADAEKNMIRFAYSETLTVNYIHLTDLVVNKMLTGRPKDKLDVIELQNIMRFKKL